MTIRASYSQPRYDVKRVAAAFQARQSISVGTIIFYNPMPQIAHIYDVKLTRAPTPGLVAVPSQLSTTLHMYGPTIATALTRLRAYRGTDHQWLSAVMALSRWLSPVLFERGDYLDAQLQYWLSPDAARTVS